MMSDRASNTLRPHGVRSATLLGSGIAVVTTMVVSPQLLGGVFPWSIALIAAMAAVTGLLTSHSAPVANDASASARLLDWLVIAAVAWTGLQLLPLPTAVVSYFVPESVDAWNAADALLHRTPHSWIPLSLDPGATLLELAKGSAIVTMYLVGRVLAASRRRHLVLIAVGTSGAAMALVAFGHRVSNAEKVFGLYEPVYAGTRLLAPLMNENHLGGFMALVTPILLGLALDSRRRESQVAWAMSAVACGVAGVLSFSRGGILALGVGLALYVIVYAVRQRKQKRAVLQNRTLLAIVTVLVLTTGLIVAVVGSDLQREFGFTENRTAKLDAARAALPVIGTHWITGVGRGAFSVAFVGEHGSAKRFFYPENLPIQWTSEWGVVFGIALL
ncbi:MAG: O-antigen ligase family protein, partial [Myxococcales bacterium]|nr:O-antigen ligase family protein [Myxococcales bacterium]